MLRSYSACFILSMALSQIRKYVDSIPPSVSNALPQSWLHICILAYLFTYLDTTFALGGYKWEWFQKLSIWRSLVSYFPGSITTSEPLLPDQNYIFATFPHGACTVQHILTMTDGVNMLSSVHKGDRRDLAASILFYIPFIRELMLLFGNVDASAATAHHNLRKRRSLLIFIGGEKEQLMTVPGEHKVYLKNRKGFIKLAIQYGVPLVPAYCFGENELYTVSNAFLPFRKFLQKTFHIGLPICFGRYGTGWPLKKPLNLCLGHPISVQRLPKEAITDEAITTLHAVFCAKLTELFDAHKERNGLSKEATLQIL